MPVKTSFPPQIDYFFDVTTTTGTHVFFSEERYLLVALKRNIAFHTRQANIETLFCDAAEPGQAREAFGAVREVGFFGKRKVIVLDYAEVLFMKEKEGKGTQRTVEGGKTTREKEKRLSPFSEMLEAVLERPDPANLLILLFNEIDRRTRMFSLMQKKEVFHELMFPSDAELQQFIVTSFHPVHPDPALIRYFLKKEQKNLFFIENEVAKLRLWAESRGLATLSLEDAEPLLSSLSEEVIFRLMDYLVTGDKARAVALFHDLRISEGDLKVFPILIMLFQRHFRVLLECRVLGKTHQQHQIHDTIVANKAFYLFSRDGVSPIERELQRVKNRTLVAALHDVARLELGMKGVYSVPITDVGVAIEQFMLRYF